LELAGLAVLIDDGGKMSTGPLLQPAIPHGIKRTMKANSENFDGGSEMNKQKAWSGMVIRFAVLLVGALLLIGCAPRIRVGELQSESQTVELGDAEAVQVEISFGAGVLDVSGGAEELLEADFSYNVARLKPVVEYTNGTLVVRQPGTEGLPALQGIADFRNEWDLRLNNEMPIDLSVDMGAGNSNLQLAGLSLNRLDIRLGASESTIDLGGDWVRDLEATIDAGAADINVKLPKDVGVRVRVESGPHTIEVAGLTKDGNVYTNAAYGVSDVTLEIEVEVGIGNINLEVE
jgi:hypothetical protein